MHAGIRHTRLDRILKEEYSSGSSWYRVYSDGWIEQGGLCTLPANWVTNTFLKSFKNTDYGLYITPINAVGSVHFTNPAGIAKIDKSSFQSGMYDGKSSWYACWFACGY